MSIDNGDGTLSVIGTNGDDLLIGSGGDDNIAPLEGDDTVDGRSGTDRVFYLEAIEDYRVELEENASGGTDIIVSSRAESTENEGTDRLSNIELLRFPSEFIGDVTIDDIRTFLYSEPGSPDLVGTEGTDWLFGDSARNILSGGGGDDTIFGGDGDDLLVGGEGGDLLIAGAGDRAQKSRRRQITHSP